MVYKFVAGLAILAFSAFHVAAQAAAVETCSAVCARRAQALVGCGIVEGSFNACYCTAANLKFLDDCSNCLITESTPEQDLQSRVARGSGLHHAFQVGCEEAGASLGPTTLFTADLDFWATSDLTRPGDAGSAPTTASPSASPTNTTTTTPAVGDSTVSNTTPSGAATTPGSAFTPPAAGGNSNSETVLVPGNGAVSGSGRSVVALVGTVVVGLLAALV